MKALPKRKGNFLSVIINPFLRRLNESPSQKEGKFQRHKRESHAKPLASMKALPKRKGNHCLLRTLNEVIGPQ